MKDNVLKGGYGFFSLGFVMSFLMYASGGCELPSTNQNNGFIQDLVPIAMDIKETDSSGTSESSSTGDSSGSDSSSSGTTEIVCVCVK